MFLLLSLRTALRIRIAGHRLGRGLRRRRARRVFPLRGPAADQGMAVPERPPPRRHLGIYGSENRQGADARRRGEQRAGPRHARGRARASWRRAHNTRARRTCTPTTPTCRCGTRQAQSAQPAAFGIGLLVIGALGRTPTRVQSLLLCNIRIACPGCRLRLQYMGTMAAVVLCAGGDLRLPQRGACLCATLGVPHAEP